MNKIVDFDGVPHELARLDRAAIESLIEADALDRLGNVEVIDGVLVWMPPSMRVHGEVMGQVFIALSVPLKERFRAGLDVAVFFGEGEMRSPDISIYPADADDHYVKADDLKLAVEVSVSTLNQDLRTKALLFSRHGVPELWIIDVNNRQTHIHRSPTPDGYCAVEVIAWTGTIHPLCAPDVAVTLSKALDGIV